MGARAKALLQRFPALDRWARRIHAHRSEQQETPGVVSSEPDRVSGPTKDLRGRFCEAPFRQLDLYETGKVHLCCSRWLPTPAGDLNVQSVNEAWNSPEAREIRESIFDGSFRFCNHTLCPRIQAETLPTIEESELNPEWADTFANDASSWTNPRPTSTFATILPATCNVQAAGSTDQLH